ADLHAAKWAIDCAKDYADPRPPIFTQHGINTHMFLWGVTVINKVVDMGAQLGRGLDFFEVFAGNAGISKQLKEWSYNVTAMDRSTCRIFEDMCLLAGLFYGALTALRVVAKGTVWFSPQCSTWGNMARHHTERSLEDPMGDTNRRDMVEANT
ncbi:unnamed protein product, partial [Prorocentrum cordatum]